MISIPRPWLRACITTFRRCAGRGDNLSVTLTATPNGVSLRCLAKGATITYTGAAKKGRGDLTVRLSVLELLDVSGRDNVVFQPEGQTKVAVVEHGSVTRTVDRVMTAVPLPPIPKSPVQPGEGFVAALAAAGGVTAPATRFAFDRIQLRCGRGEVVATDSAVLLVHGGFQLPGDKDILIPVCPAFAVPEVRNQKEVSVGVADGHLVVRSGPWLVALPVATGRFPDVEGVIPSRAAATASVELSDAALDAIKAKVPGLPVSDSHTQPVAVDIDGFGVFITAGGERLELPGCRVSGKAVRVEMDRRHLVRAIKLGFKTLNLTGPGQPLLAEDGNRRLVWASFGRDTEPRRTSPRAQRPMPTRQAPRPQATPASTPGEEEPFGGLFSGFRMLIDAIRNERTAEVVPDRVRGST